MKLSARNAFRDWHTSRDRMEIHRTVSVDWTAWILGIAALMLCAIFGWLLWQITTPAGMAMIGDLARYIWEAV